MKLKLLPSIITMLLFTNIITSQDVITKKTGEDIQSKIIEVTQNEVKFKKFDNIDGPIFSMLKSEILMVRYKNGTKDIFNNSEEKTIAHSDDMAMKGKRDAIVNYKGGSSGSGWVASTTILFSPIIGLIPAGICSSSEPLDENLNYRESELMKNTDYNNAYTKQAHKTKKGKIWKSYGISSGVWLVLILIL